MKTRIILAAMSLAVIAFVAASSNTLDEYKSGLVWPEPPVVTLNKKNVPSDAIVLFDGTNLDQFKNGGKWRIEDGIAIANQRTIVTKQAFGDCQLHLEFTSPVEVEGEGQGRGNSGVYLMGQYEIQILDSFKNKTYFDGQCGAIYKQQPPAVNVCRGPGEWQTYDILFTGPRFNADDTLKTPAYVTVLHNGVMIHNHHELQGGTFWDKPPHYKRHNEQLPLKLQFHQDAVRFRNIWIRENMTALSSSDPAQEPAKMKKDGQPKKMEKKSDQTSAEKSK